MIKLLYVEDEADLREALSEELEEDGFDVRAAANGLEGLQILSEFRPDLVITDWLMPRMTGIELIGAMRESKDGFASTPVIFLSAYSAKAHVDEAMAAGACRYITKPVNYAALLQAIADFSEPRPGGTQRHCGCRIVAPAMAGNR